MMSGLLDTLLAGDGILAQLVTWTPYLLGGFGMNILVTLLAALIGTLVGLVLTAAQCGARAGVQNMGHSVALFSIKLPTLALMFYCAVLIPNEFQIWGSDAVYPFPNWVKASLALSIAQISFTGNNLKKSIDLWGAGHHGEALLFIPNWGNNMLITVVASSSTSLIGVNELVSHCNKIISASSNPALMVPLYLYASLIFVVFCYTMTLGLKRLRHFLASRYGGTAKSRRHHEHQAAHGGEHHHGTD
jgi:polar amino acid transport system permease protein